MSHSSSLAFEPAPAAQADVLCLRSGSDLRIVAIIVAKLREQLHRNALPIGKALSVASHIYLHAGRQRAAALLLHQPDQRWERTITTLSMVFALLDGCEISEDDDLTVYWDLSALRDPLLEDCERTLLCAEAIYDGVMRAMKDWLTQNSRF